MAGIPIPKVTLPGEEDDPLKGKGYADPLQPDDGNRYQPLGTTPGAQDTLTTGGGDVAPGGGFANPINTGIITGNMGSTDKGASNGNAVFAGGDVAPGGGFANPHVIPGSDAPPAPVPGAEPPTVPGTTSAPGASTANTYTPTLQTVQPNQTVAGQVNDLLKADNPLMQTARGQAAQAANSRGLLNSSMAVQAGEQAAIESALPIASADASTYNRVGSENAAAKNASGQFNAGSQNQFNLSAQQAGQEQTLQRLRGDQATNVANIEAQYKTLMQTNASAASIFNEITKSIGSILDDPNTTAEQKQAAVDKQIQMLNASLSIMGSISNLDLTSLLNFSNLGQTPGANTPGALGPLPRAGAPAPSGTPGAGHVVGDSFVGADGNTYVVNADGSLTMRPSAGSPPPDIA